MPPAQTRKKNAAEDTAAQKLQKHPVSFRMPGNRVFSWS